MKIKFNWFEIIFYCFFVTYGYFGLMTKIGPDKNLSQFVVTTLILTALLILFGFLSSPKFTLAEDNFSLSKRDIGIFGSMLLAMILITLPQLNWAISEDPLSYAGASHIHSVQALIRVGCRLSIFSDVPFQFLAQALSFSFLIGIVIVIGFTHRLTWVFKTTIMVILFLLCRNVIYILGGNGSPHPSLELLMPFIFGAIFGINAVAMKLSYLFSSVVVLFLVFKKMQTRFQGAILYLAVAALGTIPLFLHAATSVEHTLWSGLAICYVFAELLFSNKPAYFRMVCIVSVASMMRQSSFVGLVPIFVHYFFHNAKTMKLSDSVKVVSTWFLPMLFFIPFIGKSLIYGTPTTQAVGTGSIFSKLWFAIESEIVFVTAANSVNFWWLIFIPFALFTARKDLKILILSLWSFAYASFVVFYSIHTSVWGYTKYQFEFVLPLSFIGFLIFLFSIDLKGKAAKFILTGLVILCGLNIHSYLNYQKGNKPIDELVSRFGVLGKYYDEGYRGLITVPYNYKEAFADIKNLKLAGHTYFIGGSYGVIQEILNGYTLAETISSYQIYKDQQWHIFRVLEDNSMILDSEKLNADLRISAILVGPVPLEVKLKVITQVEELGWRKYKTYSNTEYGSTLTLLLR